MANNEKQSTGLWSKTNYKGEEVWAHYTIKSLMEKTGFSIEENKIEDENTLDVHGVDFRNLNMKEYKTALRTLKAYLTEKCKKETGYSFKVYDEESDILGYYEISMYTCPIGKVGVLKYQSEDTTEEGADYSVYIGNLAWKNVKDAAIDVIDEILSYYEEISEETETEKEYERHIKEKEYDRYIEEIEKLPE